MFSTMCFRKLKWKQRKAETGKIAVIWACTTKRPDLCGEESRGVGVGPKEAGKTKKKNERLL